MLLLLKQVLRSVFQPVITLKQQKYHSVTLKKNDPNQSKAVPTNSKTNGTKAELYVYFFTKILIVVNIMYAQKEWIFSLGMYLFGNFHS